MNVIQISTLTPVGPGCVVRDDAGRPKTALVNNVQRLRIPSQSIKRALRTSAAFRQALDGLLGVRTQRIGDIVVGRLAPDVGQEAAVAAVKDIVAVFGKAKAERPHTEQLAFVAPEEIGRAHV